MKFTVAIITALILSLNQVVVTLGVQCELCPNFDASLPIDMGQLDVMMTTMEGRNGNLRRNLQIFQGDDDDGEMMEWISCAQISAGIELMGSDNIDAATCGYFEMMAMMFCGCDNGACSTCSDGSPYPDLDAIPNYEAWSEMGMDMGSEMEQPGTCRELVTQMGVNSVLMSTFVEDPPLNDDVSVNEDFTTMAPSELDVGDMTALLCGLAGMACDCPQIGCPICEFGVENPDFIPENDDDDFIMTCAQGAKMLQQMMVPVGMCNDAKIQFDDAGCLCMEEMESDIVTDETIDDEVIVDVVIVDDNTTITNGTSTVEISNATESPTSKTPNDTPVEANSSGTGHIFDLSLHSTAAATTTTMFLAIVSLFLFV